MKQDLKNQHRCLKRKEQVAASAWDDDDDVEAAPESTMDKRGSLARRKRRQLGNLERVSVLEARSSVMARSSTFGGRRGTTRRGTRRRSSVLAGAKARKLEEKQNAEAGGADQDAGDLRMGELSAEPPGDGLNASGETNKAGRVNRSARMLAFCRNNFSDETHSRTIVNAIVVMSGPLKDAHSRHRACFRTEDADLTQFGRKNAKTTAPTRAGTKRRGAFSRCGVFCAPPRGALEHLSDTF